MSGGNCNEAQGARMQHEVSELSDEMLEAAFYRALPVELMRKYGVSFGGGAFHPLTDPWFDMTQFIEETVTEIVRTGGDEPWIAKSFLSQQRGSTVRVAIARLVVDSRFGRKVEL